MENGKYTGTHLNGPRWIDASVLFVIQHVGEAFVFNAASSSFAIFCFVQFPPQSCTTAVVSILMGQ